VGTWYLKGKSVSLRGEVQGGMDLDRKLFFRSRRGCKKNQDKKKFQ